MEIIFLRILNLSIEVIPVLLICLLCRLIFINAPKKTRLLWWLLALLGFLPIPYPALYSYWGNNKPFPQSYGEVISSNLPAANPQELVSFLNPASTSSTELTVAKPPFYFLILTWIWIIGVLIFIIYTIIQMMQLYRITRVSLKEHTNIMLCDGISTPFVIGLFRPLIYIPSSLSDTEKELIIIHEKIHIQRKDNIWKIIAYVLLTVFWFHPLVWISYSLFNQDLEYICDDLAIKDISPEKKKLYAKLILALGTKNSRTPEAFSTFGANPKRRILEIVKNKKSIPWLGAAAVLIAVICGVVFLPAHNDNTLNNLMPQIPSAQKEGDIVVPVNLEKTPYFICQNKVFHLYNMGTEYPLETLSLVDFSDTVSNEELKYWKDQIEVYNLDSYGVKNFDLVFYQLEGYSTDSYLALADQKRRVAMILINDNGYVLSSPSELFERKAFLSNYESITVHDLKNSKQVTIKKNELATQNNLAEHILNDITQGEFGTVYYSSRLSSAFQYAVSFYDPYGISKTILISRDQEVFIPSFGDTPAVPLSPKTYEEITSLFEQ